MLIHPNESRLVEMEYWKDHKVNVWNRTDVPITVYYTLSKGIEIHSSKQRKNGEKE